eukprot:2470171-Rhodomonas_salina.2
MEQIEKEDEETKDAVAALHRHPDWRSALEIIITHHVEAMTDPENRVRLLYRPTRPHGNGTELAVYLCMLYGFNKVWHGTAMGSVCCGPTRSWCCDVGIDMVPCALYDSCLIVLTWLYGGTKGGSGVDEGSGFVLLFSFMFVWHCKALRAVSYPPSISSYAPYTISPLMLIKQQTIHNDPPTLPNNQLCNQRIVSVVLTMQSTYPIGRFTRYATRGTDLAMWYASRGTSTAYGGTRSLGRISLSQTG